VYIVLIDPGQAFTSDKKYCLVLSVLLNFAKSIVSCPFCLQANIIFY